MHTCFLLLYLKDKMSHQLIVCANRQRHKVKKQETLPLPLQRKKSVDIQPQILKLQGKKTFFIKLLCTASFTLYISSRHHRLTDNLPLEGK